MYIFKSLILVKWLLDLNGLNRKKKMKKQSSNDENGFKMWHNNCFVVDFFSH